MQNLIHESHLGISKCKQRAHEVLRTPTLRKLLRTLPSAQTFNGNNPKLLIARETPRLLFMMVGTDLFDFESETYLLTVDYYLKFTEVDRLQDLGSNAIIEVLHT